MPLCGSASSHHVLRSGLIPALVLAMFAVPLFATTIVLPDDAELIAKSSLIATGTVVGSDTVEIEGKLFTDTSVLVAETLHGSVGKTLVVRQAGGRTATRARILFGAPEYEIGERVLLFLAPAGDGYFHTVDLAAGKFSERLTANGNKLWHRSNELAGTTLLDGQFRKMQSKGNPQRAAQAFETWIHEKASGGSPEARYMISNPEIEGRESVSFATLAENEIHRWFRFDDGGTVSWKTVGEQAGFENAGVPEFEAALRVWSTFDGAQIRYAYAGRAESGQPAATANGVNEILFNDPFSEIFGRWNGQSGVLAQAEYHVVKVNRSWTAPFEATTSHPAKTFPEVWEIVEGNIVIQEGVSPFYRVGDVMLTQIIAHELGHTLGLAHSRDTEALMASTIDGTGAFLRHDDKLAASWLYPRTAGPSNPPAAPPAPEIVPVDVDFSVSKEFTTVAETLELVDRTTGSPLAWEWSFGDGRRSTERNPLHRYETPGTYLVTLSASNGVFTSSRTRTVVVTAEPLAHSLIPVATQTAGASGTSWQTELTVYNGGTDTVEVTAAYLPHAGGDRLTRSLTIDAGAVATFENALPELFGVTAGTGAIEISTPALLEPDTIQISSRTFTGHDSGSYGLSVPEVLPSAAVTYITGIESSLTFRTNIGLVNRSVNELVAVLTLLSANGETIGSHETRLEGRSFSQTPLTVLFPILAERSEESMTLRVEAERDGALSSYASVVDNRSQDPFLIPAKAAPSNEVIVPGVARIAGSGGTFWRTDVSMFNPASTPLTVQLRLLGSNAERSLILGPGETGNVKDVFSWLGVEMGHDALVIAADGASGPVISSRTYTSRVTDEATFGQWVEESDHIDLSVSQSLTGVKANSRFRTNAGIVNTSDTMTDVELIIHRDNGSISTVVRVEPRSQVQLPLSAAFPGLELDSGATVSARSLDGVPILFYASVVDNRSGDPTFLQAR